MTKAYEIYLDNEYIDTIYCQSESEANRLAEEICPDDMIFVQEKNNDQQN